MQRTKPRPSRRRQQLSQQHTRDIKKAFDLFDISGTGTIQGKELRVALRALGFDLKKEEIDNLVFQQHTSTPGLIDFHRFLNIIIEKVSEPDTPEDIERAFAMMDSQRSGTISKENLQKIINDLGEDMTEEEVEKMIRVAQKGSKEAKMKRKAEVTLTEFKAIMDKTE